MLIRHPAPPGVTLHGAMELCRALRAMTEATDVLLIELGDGPDGLAVLAMRAAAAALRQRYDNAVSPALDGNVRVLLEARDDIAS